MKSSYTTLLVTSCISLSLYSMEPQPLSSSTLNSSTAIQINHIKVVQTQYKQIYDTLEAITPNNNNAPINLLKIIEKTDNLKSQGITELQMGAFAFAQDITLRNQLFNHGQGPYNSPWYISVFFKRLDKYYESLNKKALSTPTQEQYEHYKNNQIINANIEIASSFNVPIDITLLRENNIFKDVSTSVAAEEFHQLLADVYTIRNTHPKIIEALAGYIYGSVTAKK
jgi:hypothetical protein